MADTIRLVPGVGYVRYADEDRVRLVPGAGYVKTQATSGGTTINATTAALTVATLVSVVNAKKAIAATTAAITIVANAATITVGSDTNINATTAAISATPYQASINAEKTISATTAGITASTYQAAIVQGLTISATTGSISVTPYQAGVNAEKSISATTAGITTATYQATIAAGCATGTQDYSAYTETDPNTHITVTSNCRLDFSTLNRNESAYVYKDFGASHFSGDFTHQFNFKVDSWDTGTAGRIIVWGMSNTVGTPDDESDSYYIRFNYGGDLTLFERDGGTPQSIALNGLGNTTRYWVEVERVDSTDTLTMRVYTDEFVTQTGTDKSLSLTGSAVDWRYLFALSSHDDATASEEATGYVSSLNTNEGVTGTASFELGSFDFTAFGGSTGTVTTTITGTGDFQLGAFDFVATAQRGATGTASFELGAFNFVAYGPGAWIIQSDTSTTWTDTTDDTTTWTDV